MYVNVLYVPGIKPADMRSGGACVSPSGDRLYVTNLADGIDVYRLDREQPASSAFERTFKTSLGANLPVPIACVHRGSHLLIGGTQGHAQLLSSDQGASGDWTRTSPAYAGK